MKRVVRSLLLFLCTTLFMLSASVCVCVIRVYADAPTYTKVQGIFELGNFKYGSNYYYTAYSSSEVRLVAASNLTNTVMTILYSKSPFTYGSEVSRSAYPSTVSTTSNASSFTEDGETIYYAFVFNSQDRTGIVFADGINVVNDTYSNTRNETTARYYNKYAFGGSVVDPVEPVIWGLIDLEGYQTQVAGQGNASINNVDVISWNDTFDTNSNDISTGNVRVRYVPGYYRATSKQNLLAQTYQDFVLDIVSAVNGDVYPVSDGSASFRWGDVIGSLSIPFYSIYNLTNSTEGWLKRGWIYEVRLEIDDYIGEWQTVYSSTSSGVENDMTIVNTTVITQETITAIQNINSINGTTNIWIINGTPVDPNPEYEPPASNDDKPWWAYLLEMINNTLGIQNQYINEGTDESIDIVNNFEDDHDDLNVTVNDYDEIENNIVDNMNDNIDNLDIESDLIENNSFLSSARWVAEQYTRITTDNPIGSILKFSLVLGFVMIFLGRFK